MTLRIALELEPGATWNDIALQIDLTLIPAARRISDLFGGQHSKPEHPERVEHPHNHTAWELTNGN